MTGLSRYALWGSIFAFLAIAGGAFGAHALAPKLSATQASAFETGVRYQMYHAIALVSLPALSTLAGTSILAWAGRFFVVGTFAFSGSLYFLALSGIGLFGTVTPLGGLCFLAGWVMIALGVFKGPTS